MWGLVGKSVCLAEKNIKPTIFRSIIIIIIIVFVVVIIIISQSSSPTPSHPHDQHDHHHHNHTNHHIISATIRTIVITITCLLYTSYAADE